MATSVEAAILDLFSRPPRTHVFIGPSTTSTEWAVTVGEEMPPPALAGSVRFVKTLCNVDQAVSVVTYTAQATREWLDVFHLRRDHTEGWCVRGRVGGLGPWPDRLQPWANLGGGFGPDGGYAGGSVSDKGFGVASVALTDAHGRTCTDRVKEGCVCFLTTEPFEGPIRVDLYDVHGACVGSHDSGLFR
jgi:hypothetical protein